MREYDKILYKERNWVERLFNRLKHYKRVATRYGKTTVSYLGFLTLASTILWLSQLRLRKKVSL